MENKAMNKPAELGDAAEINFLTPENASFKLENELLMLKLSGDARKKYEDSLIGFGGGVPKNPENETISEIKPKNDYFRIYLHRAFPFDDPEAYISVQNIEKKEIGLIRTAAEFDEATEKLLVRELDIKYYTPKITKIYGIKERYGFSYWNVATDNGDMQFTLQDTYRSMMKIGMTRIMISDIDGNRYEIPDVEALDHKSYRKIELYL